MACHRRSPSIEPSSPPGAESFSTASPSSSDSPSSSSRTSFPYSSSACWSRSRSSPASRARSSYSLPLSWFSDRSFSSHEDPRGSIGLTAASSRLPWSTTMKRTRFAKTVAGLTLCLAIGAGLLVSPSVDAAPSAQEIMEKASETRIVDGSEAIVKMSIVSEKGQVRERTLNLATKLFDGGKTEKRVYRFTSPPDVNGTGVLVYDYDAKDDDIWVYLPALRKTRRIVSSQRSKSFMGSEFSYADVNAPTLSDYDYKLLKEEAAGGEACWVVEVAPKNDKIAKDEGYSKKIYWVSKATYAIRKGEFYDLDG